MKEMENLSFEQVVERIIEVVWKNSPKLNDFPKNDKEVLKKITIGFQRTEYNSNMLKRKSDFDGIEEYLYIIRKVYKMENIFFSKTIADNYNNQFLTIGDFVKICDVIKVGVFEVMIENHPKNREVKYNVYKNMSEYISTVPECFPKEETDPSIAEGKFDVSFAEYQYHFEVVGQSVVVHCMKTFEE